MPEAETRVDPLANIRVVLVRPQGAANVGAAARAMKNLGVRDLALVGTSRRRIAAAKTTAVRAEDLLQDALVVPTIEAALEDCTLVVGTSGQGGIYREDPESPQEIAPDILRAAARGRVAILFGPEHHGLTRDDLRPCDRLVAMDTDDAYPSLNLAQAVLLMCYELRRQWRAGVVTEARPAARAEDVARIENRMRAALLEMGFLNPQNPDRIMFVLRRLLGRAVPRPFEAKVLMALAGQLEWCAKAATAAKRAGVVDDRRD